MLDEKAWLTINISVNPKGVYWGLAQGSMQTTGVSPHQTCQISRTDLWQMWHDSATCKVTELVSAAHSTADVCGDCMTVCLNFTHLLAMGVAETHELKK